MFAMRLFPPARLLLCGLGITAVLGVPAARADRRTEVDVVVDMSAEGRRVTPPSPGHPTYCLVMMAGYREMGGIVAGEQPPNPDDVERLVLKTLSDQSYLATTVVESPNKDGSKKALTLRKSNPTLIVQVVWGCLNPVSMESDPTDPSTKVVLNRDQMLGLVGGNTLNNLDLNFEREGVMQASGRDRYFVALTAYDMGAYERTHKKVMLWQAKMSVDTAGVTQSQVLAALVTSGGPLLGRETKRPKMLLVPVTPDGRVDIGVPTVKDYQDVPPPPPPSSATLPDHSAAH